MENLHQRCGLRPRPELSQLSMHARESLTLVRKVATEENNQPCDGGHGVVKDEVGVLEAALWLRSWSFGHCCDCECDCNWW